MAVYSHIALLTSHPSVPAPTASDLLRPTRKVYNGDLRVGEDLLVIEVGDKVKAAKFTPSDKRPIEAIK